MIFIRSMIPDDVPKLAAIVSRNYNKHCAEAFHHEAQCAFYHYPFPPHFVVAELDGVVAGCACWVADWCSWGVFNISWVQVHSELQSAGIGKELVGAVLQQLRPLSSLILLATTKPGYYEKHWGFKAIQTYRANTKYEDDGEVETLMALAVKPEVA